jgi:sigma-B regulation protein RsbU (phosphoserine phosphatase)
MVKFTQPKPIVLIVEDDPHGRSFMESSLQISGFEVLSAQSAEAARETINKVGIGRISVILSDYRLPNQTGTQLLEWVRSLDSCLSTMIITGQDEKAIVEESISVGVFQYLEKPVTHQFLREVVGKAAEETSLKRKYQADRRGLKELENLDQSMNDVVPESLQDRMTVFYRPLHEVGGDFLITHQYEDDRHVVVVGDVAGHDIRSGFVSTYFQGMFKGSLESGGDIEKAFELSNRSLLMRRAGVGQNQDLISLSLSAIDLRNGDDSIRHWNFGLGPCVIVSDNGVIELCETGQFPLGWIPEIETDAQHINLESKSLLYIFTDGLADFADTLKVNLFSLLYRFLHRFNESEDLPVMPSDDILLVRFLLNTSMPLSQTFEPILSEHYAGTELEHIDHLQSNWRRSISFALDDRLGDRLYDLLICIREGMINALTHGCEKSADKFAHLQISINEDKDTLRIYIDDPGKGHEFDLVARLERLGNERGENLGLGIIQHLSDSFKVENKGTSLVFDFSITPDKN